MPWSGKSTLWKLLAKKLGCDFLDFDDDIIEVTQWEKVSDMVANMSEDAFKKREEELCLNINFSNTIFSTSGSLPYSKKSMDHLKGLWTIIYLKVDITEIMERLNFMKTDRIIWMKNNNFEKLFLERENLYENVADIVFCYSGNDIHKITTHLAKVLKK